jgi:Holliday junction DNA helicase RuvA
MIGRVSGILIEKEFPFLVIDCGGIGYELEASKTTIEGLPDLGSEVSVFTHLAIRDDAHLLYAFSSLNERSLFRSLLKVNGVGTKVALVILSGMDVAGFIRCVQTEDRAQLSSLPGLGKKTAERLIVEMRDKVLNFAAEVNSGSKSALGNDSTDSVGDAVSGLIALGYKPNDASKYVRQIDTTGLTSENIIREVLRGLATR